MSCQNNRCCQFCYGPLHETIKCPLETIVAPLLKKKVGNLMEYYIANNVKCPECNNLTLHVIGNNVPSLDIVCKNCYRIFEVKSKCLSSVNIPQNIIIPHGSYYKFIDRCNEGLNLIIIIYGIDRYNKNIIIREILYINNHNLKDESNINIKQNENNTLSTIFIKNKFLLNKIELNNNNIISFYEDIEIFKKTINNLNK